MTGIRVYHALGGALKRKGRADGVTPPPAIATFYGYPTNETDSPLSERLAWWDNRAPIVRRYSGTMIPAAFHLDTATCPEKRVSYSFKADGSGSFTIAGLAAGDGNARIIGWLESIPTGWHVDLTWYHEVNDDIREGRMTPAQFQAVYAHLRTCIDTATLAANVTVRLVPNFMAYLLTSTPDYFDDSWVPPRGVADILTFDIYGNPGHFTSSSGANKYGTATGIGYGTTYPDVTARFQDMFAAIERIGYADSWGILEINAPARDWDTTEAARAQWHRDAIAHCLAPPMTGSVPPKIFLLWESPSGVNWDQSYGRVSGNPLTVSDVWKPYILGTPIGG